MILSSFVNGVNSQDYVIDDDNIKISLTPTLQEEKARQFCNISLEDYGNMVGTRDWVHLSPYQNGTLTCKADVLVAYMMLSPLENIRSDIQQKRRRK